MYGDDSLSPSGSGMPKVLKSLGNLTTSISTVHFNRDSQLMAIASNHKKDQMRLVSRISAAFGPLCSLCRLQGPPSIPHFIFELANIQYALRARHCRGLLSR